MNQIILIHGIYYFIQLFLCIALLDNIIANTITITLQRYDTYVFPPSNICEQTLIREWVIAHIQRLFVLL